MVQRAADSVDNAWLQFARDSHAADKRMACIAFLTGVLEGKFGEEKRWVEEHAEQLSDVERNMIESLDTWLGLDVHWLTRSDRKPVSALPTNERRQIILSELEKSVQSQVDAFEKLRQEVEGEVETKPEA